MSQPEEPNDPKFEETRITPSQNHLPSRKGAQRAGAQAPPEQSSEHARSRFSLILHELDLRSRKSNQWLTALSLFYVAIIVFLAAGLYFQFAKVEELVDLLEKDLDRTKEAIAEQASLHKEQSKEISGRIDETGVILDEMGQEREILESQLEEGKLQAEGLLKRSVELETKITKIDTILESLSKRAEPFSVQYAIAPDKPKRFSRGQGVDVLFEKPIAKAPAPHADDTEIKGKFHVPTAGTYLITGWFSTDEDEEPPSTKHVVETEIRIDGIPHWTGFSYGNGIFTSGVPLRTGQIISIHATVRSSDDEESDPPSGKIESGEIRIARLYHAP